MPPALRSKLIDLHRPRNPRLLMPKRRDGAKRGGKSTRHTATKKGNGQSSDEKSVKIMVEKSVEIRGGFLDR